MLVPVPVPVLVTVLVPVLVPVPVHSLLRLLRRQLARYPSFLPLVCAPGGAAGAIRPRYHRRLRHQRHAPAFWCAYVDANCSHRLRLTT